MIVGIVERKNGEISDKHDEVREYSRVSLDYIITLVGISPSVVFCDYVTYSNIFLSRGTLPDIKFVVLCEGGRGGGGGSISSSYPSKTSYIYNIEQFYDMLDIRNTEYEVAWNNIFVLGGISIQDGMLQYTNRLIVLDVDGDGGSVLVSKCKTDNITSGIENIKNKFLCGEPNKSYRIHDFTQKVTCSHYTQLKRSLPNI